MTQIRFEQMKLDKRVIPASIYGTLPYYVTELALVLGMAVKMELQELLKRLIARAGIMEEKGCGFENKQGMYFRIDAYIDPDLQHISVLEVNAHFVDGWGIALNLMTAANQRPGGWSTGWFPRYWTSPDPLYRPEMKLARGEIEWRSDIGDGAPIVMTEEVGWEAALTMKEPVYWYGRFRRADREYQIVPRHGAHLDDKRWLAEVEPEWSDHGRFVQIPRFYRGASTPWDQLPDDVYLKYRNKWENDRPPVLKSSLKGGRGTRRDYRDGEMVAQQVVPTVCVDGRPIQAIILCIGTEPFTGYIQHAHKPDTTIINDNSEHGPLVFEKE